jgi:hypothetical protein
MHVHVQSPDKLRSRGIPLTHPDEAAKWLKSYSQMGRIHAKSPLIGEPNKLRHVPWDRGII